MTDSTKNGNAQLKIDEPVMLIDLPAANYHRHESLSVSGLKEFARSPLHYRYSRDNPKEPTKAMQIGTAFHSLVLEADMAGDVFVVAPDVDRRTKAGKETWSEFEADVAGRIVLKLEEYKKLLSMALSIRNHPEASELLARPGMTEVSIFWQDIRGVWCKCRPDRVTEDGIILDLKTTDDASPEAFAKACARFKYHWQASVYLHGLTAATRTLHKDFRLIAVEKEPPYGVAVYRMPQVYTDIAAEQMSPLLDEYARCVESGLWPGYSDKTEIIQMPVWALRTEYEEA